MDLFKLVGKLAINGADEAKKEITGTTETASKEGGKMQQAFAKIGESLKNAFKSDEPKAFGKDLSALSGVIGRQESYLDALKKKYESLYLEFGENSDEARACANEIEKLSTELKQNKSALKDAEEAANKFDKSLDEAGDGAEEAENGIVEAMKKIGAAVAAAFAVDAIKDFGAKCVEIADSSSSAINGFAASTGTTTDELGKYEDVMLRIYKNNFGESFEDVAGSMATIKQQAGDMGADELEKMTTNAIMLRDTFDFEVNESFRAAQMLVDQFGISGEQAYNLIAQGAQSGLNKNDDLLDSINEYSVHYEQLGFTAEDFFNSLANGTAAGTFSVDKLGDAMKEFGIRAKDGSDGSREAFKTLGLDADEMFSKFNKGGEDAKSATQQVIEKLMEMPPGVEQTTTGVALFGTMWEDLGAEGIAALGNLNGGISSTKDKLGEINAVKYDDIGSAIGGLQRAFETNLLLPIGDSLIPIIEKAVEKLNEFGTWCSENETTLTIIGIAVGTLTAAITAYNIAQNAAAIATAISTAATTAFGAVLAFVTSPITLVVLAIGALIAIGVLLYQNWDTIKEKCSEIWGNITAKFTEIKDNIVGKVTEMKDKAVAKFNELKDKAKEKFENIKQATKEKFNAVKETMGTVMQAAKETVSEKLSNIKSAYDEHGGGIKGVAAAAMEGVKGYYSAGFSFIDNLTGGKLSNIVNSVKTKMDSAKAAISEKLESIKSKFSSIFETVKTTVSNAIDKVKGMFNFSWSLPKIKLPHFSIKGKFSLDPPLIPKISVQWYRKAMDTPMLLDRATIFGYSGATGKYLGGGEAGSEMVGGTETIMQMIQNAVATQNADMLTVLTKILNAILAMDDNMGGHLREALEDMGLEVNNREFARLVKAVK